MRILVMSASSLYSLFIKMKHCLDWNLDAYVCDDAGFKLPRCYALMELVRDRECSATYYKLGAFLLVNLKLKWFLFVDLTAEYELRYDNMFM